ncbi:unnamed protein product, partial [Coregonus sp. 'balchen']
GLGWADLEDKDGRVYAKARDLWVALPIAVAFLVIRQIFERLVATPLAAVMGVKEKVRLTVSHNPTLESFYCNTTKNPTQSSIDSLCKQTGCSERQKPWLYDFKEMWQGFPILTLLPSQYWYYMIELGFYGSLIFSVASDVKRKDFKEQMVHHMATIFLISFSWCVNYIRAGTLIMLLHDSSDYLLESAKIFIYAGWRNTSNYVFFLFATVFIFTRLYIFPFYIIYATYVYPLTMYSPFFGYYFLNVLMMVLQCLHIFWAILILRMAVRFLSSDEKVEDERSDKEETDESGEEEEEVKKKGAVQNGDATHNNHRKTE